jgi:hypothetical protein
VHKVKTAYVAGASGSGVLTGMGFLRTPGFGQYTFGIGLPDDYSGPVAGQTGIWQMTRSGNTVTAQFGDLALSGEIENANSCHSVVITGYFARELAFPSEPAKMRLTMYVDGVATTPQTFDGILRVDDVMKETVIGDPLATENVAALPAPVILNTALSESTPWTLGSFSEQLCDGN